MKRRIMILYLLLPCFFVSKALAQKSYFEKLYENTDILYSVEPTTDGGYILSGLRTGSYENYVLLMKVDANGDTVWREDFPGLSETYGYRTAAIPTDDDSYLLVGTTDNEENSDIFLIKTASDGLVIWRTTYGDSLNLKSWSVQQMLEGGYLIEARKDANYKYLIKVNSTGQVEWEKDLGMIATFQQGYQTIQTADSGYVYALPFSLTKLNQNRDTLWTKSLSHRFYLIQELSDGNLILVGNNVLAKTTSTGEEIWKQEPEIEPNDLFITVNGDIILAGDHLIRFNSDGTELWSVPLDDLAYSCSQASGGIIFCGKLMEVPENRRGWLVKTEADGFYKSILLLQPPGEVGWPINWYSGNVQLGLSYPILWRSYNIEEINIEYSDNNGLDWSLLTSGYPAEEGNYEWLPVGLPTSEGVIRLSEMTNPDFFDQNDLPFSVVRGYDYIAINDIKMYFSNYGRGSHDPTSPSPGWGDTGPGLYWPISDDGKKTTIMIDGLFWSGKVNDVIQTNGNRYWGIQRPGNIFQDGGVGNPDSTLYSIWKIRYDWGVYPPGLERDRLEHDYHNWPVEIGAPWIDNNQNGIYDPEIDQPKLYGDETNWFVMNDVGDYPFTWRVYRSDEIGLEIQCTVYGYNREDALGDVVFKKYRMINKGQNFVEDMYFGYWSDPDLGDPYDDFVGCDTLLDLAYCYNADNEDGDGSQEWTYGISPPAVGYVLLQGPIMQSFPIDSAFFNDLWMTGYTNIEMTSFYIYTNPDMTFMDPQSGVYEGGVEVNNNLQGLHWNGNPIIDPTSGDSTKFPLSGDPVKGSGWYEGDGWPGGLEPSDRRMQIGTGPFDFAPGDTQEIVIAIVLAQGEDHLDSVTKLKEKAAAVRQFYYTGTLSGIRHPASAHPTSFRLEQNFPNPFNPTTAIGYRLSAVSKVDLSIYNVLGQKIVTLVSEKQKAGDHQVEWDASRFASGVYFYILRAGDYRDVKKMVLLK